MRKIYKSLIGIITLLFAVNTTKAQLAGTFSVPATYTSIAAAIIDLNTQGVNGPVTILINPGYTETAPVGGYTLTATGTLANPITFQKNGPGANPLITAYSGGVGTPGTAVQDGVWRFIGSDYITINGIDITDPNASNPATMEFGYGFFKASATDGCQNNTIKNCVITLNKINNATGTAPAVDGSRGIDVVNALTGAHTTAVTVTSAAGTNSNNKFYSNTIQNCNIGIALIGYAAASPFTNADQNNDIGGNLLANGNSIINFGGAAAAANPAAAIRTLAQYSINVSYNTINNNNGAGANHVTTIRGIYLNTATSANATVSNNTLTINGGGTTSQISVIENVSGSTAASNTINISNNVMSNCTYSTVTSGAFYFIYNNGATPAYLNINNNTFTGLTLNAVNSSGAINYIYNSGAIGTAMSVASNTIQNATNLNTSGTIYFVYNSNGTQNYTIQSNYVNNISRANALGGTMYGFYNFGSPSGGTALITGNTYSNLGAGNGATTFYGLYQATSTSQIEIISNNLITNISGGTSTMYGIYHSYGNAGSAVNNNTVSNISGANIVYGITHGNISSTSLNVNNNLVNTLSSTGATAVYGIYQIGANTTNTYKNKVYDISGSNASSTVFGIYISAGTTSNLHNNYVGDIRATVANAAIPLGGIYIAGGTTANLYYNTVYLSATSAGALFGTAAIYASTTPNLNLRNNIFINNSTASGAGITAAYRRTTATLSTYSASSNNNLFYAGVPGASNVIFYDGTTAQQTLGNFQAFVTPRDVASVTENTPFTSLVGSSPSFLHVLPTGGSLSESAAVNIAGITDDYDADIRQGNIGYVGTGTAPDIGADEYATVLPNCNAVTGASISPVSATICASQTLNLVGTGYTNGSGIVQQWQVSNTPGGPYSNVVGGIGANSVSYITPTLAPNTYYYVLLTTCTISGSSAISNEGTVTVNPIPSVSVSPNTSTICIPGGTTVTLNASGANTYTWSPGTGLTGTVGASVGAFPPSTIVYTVTGSNAFGCTGINTATVNIGEAPSFVPITASQTLICGGGNSSLQAQSALTSSYAVTSITYAPIPTPTTGVTILDNLGVAVTPLSGGSLDDGYWSNLPLPFNFNFFGTTYNTFAVGTNGYIFLGSGNPGTTTGYNNVFPSTTPNRPCIAAIYSDLDWDGAVGTIQTFTTGVAPNRKLVVNYTGGQFWSNTGSVTAQAIIYETSNVIEVHTFQSTAVNPAVEGIQNAAGTVAYIAPGRNNVNYVVAVPDAYRWSPAGGPVSYSWSPATYLNFTNISNPVANTVTSSIIYTAVATATNGCSSSGTISIFADVNPTLSIAGPTAVCSGNSLSLTASGAVNYTWSTGAITATIANTPTANVTYSVIGTNTAGCSGSAFQSVTVNITPTVTIAGNNTVCAGQPVLLTASGANSYSWSIGALTPTIAPTPTANATYSVIGLSIAGCSATAAQNVTLVALPTVTITSAPSAICVGQTATLIASASGADTYSWSNGANIAIIAVSPTVNTAYTITVGSNITGCTNFAVQTLTVNPIPNVAITGPTVICLGNIINLNASGANTYLWSNGANTASIAVSPTVNTTYTVTGTSTAGCIGSAVKSVSINPVLLMIVSSSSPSICVGTSANLFANGANSYTWSTGANTGSIIVSPTVNTTYTVTGTSSITGCSDTKTISITVDPCLSTGVAGVSASFGSIAIYPNPNNGEFTVELNNGLKKEIQITDVTGRVVLTITDDSDKIKANINTLANGVYYVKVSSASASKVFKIIKE